MKKTFSLPGTTAIVLLMLTMLYLPITARGQQGDDEISLSFSHPAVGRYYISALYSNGQVYLPVTELFNLLLIYYEPLPGNDGLRGSYMETSNTWSINTVTRMANFNRRDIAFTAGDFRRGEMDLYLLPQLFEEIFGLRFEVNLLALHVSVRSETLMPVEARQRRERMKEQLQRKRGEGQSYPLLHPRKHSPVGAGFLDYNFGFATDNTAALSSNYNLSGGLEFAGGQLQANLSGVQSTGISRASVNNMFWRYAINNELLTNIRLGQINTQGLQPNRIIGASLSNEPIMPRRLFDNYAIEGTTIPESEVELYINNQLADFTKADALGLYQFFVPFSYGNIMLRLRIYTPAGEIIEQERQVQIPFLFLPKGEFTYQLQGGLVDNGDFESLRSETYAIHAGLAYGISNQITARVGTDYTSSDSSFFNFVSVSARIFQQYLASLDLAPGEFYRLNASVYYNRGQSLQLVVTQFDKASLFNARNALRSTSLGFYVPVRFSSFSSGVRLSAEHLEFDFNRSQTNYRIDLDSRLGRVNMRVNYRDRLIRNPETPVQPIRTMAAAFTYSLPNQRGIPGMFRGIHLRTQLDYDVQQSQFTQLSAQLSKNIRRYGRAFVNTAYDIQAKSLRTNAGLTLDFRPVRSNTQINIQSGNYQLQQNISGSVGLDAKHARLQTSNRNQVGLAALSIRMFVDDNDNGVYDPGEKIVPSRAIRMNQAAQMQLDKEGILRISQLQPFWKYEIEVVKSMIPDPTLVPGKTYFSVVTDPNRFKKIDIPLYRTGFIEGSVLVKKAGQEQGLGGLRLILRQTGSDNIIVRTFTDGSFYADGLLPGNYTLTPDQTQLDFLNMTAIPAELTLTVKALVDGDFIEGLDFLITDDTGQQDDPSSEMNTAMLTLAKSAREALRLLISSQNAFYAGNYAAARVLIEQSLLIYELDQALALKGSILFILGLEDEAMKIWQQANQRNPEIKIPSREELNRLNKQP